MRSYSLQRPKMLWVSISLFALLASLVATFPALAGDYQATLEGSFFEIDDNANLKVDSPSGFDDWMSVTETRRTDLATGQNDDSFKGGTKEDTACPNETTGSIPNNKSDLKTFGVYQEPGVGSHPGFLHIYWSRVQDPSGTTLMDFEFNQSTTKCKPGSRFNQRTVGDFLIEYAIDQGGARANVTIREWNGSAWGPAQDLGQGAAAGTINQTAIPAADSDIGALDARTFGEASIDLAFIFDEGACQSFGSAYLKSRSSDSFTSQLKDFIAPEPITLTNCGSLLVEKVETGTTTRIDGAEFTVTPGKTDANGTTATSSVMPEVGTGLFCIENLLLGVEYTVTETVVPDGYDGAAPQEFTVTDTRSCAKRVADSDTPDLTFENQPLGDLSIRKYLDANENGTRDTGDDTDADTDGWSFVVKDSEGTTVCSGTTGSGDNATGTLLCEDLLPGTYTVTETQKTGFYNTEPGDGSGGIAETATVSQNATVTLGTTYAEFGNTCYRDVSMTINGIDGTFHDIDVVYRINAGTPTTIEDHTDASLTDALKNGDTFEWWFTLVVEEGDTPQESSHDSFTVTTASGWDTCAISRSLDFGDTEVSGSKFKDFDDDGVFDEGFDGPLAGFVFELREDDGTTVIDTATSNAEGLYTFTTRVEPGTYRVYELGMPIPGTDPVEYSTDWAQTAPVDGTGTATYRTVVVGLEDDTATVGAFLNAPLGDLSITFTDPTGRLALTTITCVDADGVTLTDDDGDGSALTFSGDDLRVRDSIDDVTGTNDGVVCTIKIVDP